MIRPEYSKDEYHRRLKVASDWVETSIVEKSKRKRRKDIQKINGIAKAKLSKLEKPFISTIDLSQNGIHIEITEIGKTGPNEIIFRYFDVGNNLTSSKWKYIVILIFEFMAWHGFDKPFRIIIHTWNNSRREIYSNSLHINKSTLKDFNLVPDSKLKDFMAHCVAYEFNSVNTGRFFNTDSF